MWLNGWMDVMGEWMDGCYTMDGWLCWMDGLIVGWIDECLGWMDGWMDGWYA